MKYEVNIENSIRMVYAIRFFILLEVKAISKDTPRINEEIRARELRVVGPENEQIGIMSGREALALAEEKHLDLVEIAPNAKPPVARIMNYGKYYVKMKNASKFLGEGNKVKVTIMFRGRELSHPELGMAVLTRFAEELKETASIEKAAKLEGRNMTMILVSK